MNINEKYKTVSEWAYAYRKMGWSVVPLYDYTKAPNNIQVYDEVFGWMPGWKQMQTRLATDKEFDSWFGNDRATGLGIITGKISNVFVVDEDSYKADGMKFELFSPFRAKSGRGGTHHFFKYSEGTKTVGFRKGVNIEIKSDGGFLVLPPSKVYVDDKKTIGNYEWIEVCSLDKLPTLTEEQLSPYKLGGTSFVTENLNDLVKVEKGEQHNSLRTLALVTLNRFKESEWDIAKEFIRKTASEYNPPAQPYKTEQIIRDCMDYIKKNPKISAAVPTNSNKPKTLTDVYNERMVERDLEKDAPKTGYAELDELIKGFIPGHLYTLTGNTNVGKTTLAANFSERVRKQGRKVLYFALEPDNTIIDYLSSVRLNKKFADLTDEDLKFDDDGIHIYGKDQVPTITDLVNIVTNSDVKYDLIVVDHIGYFIKGDSSNLVQEQSNAVKTLVSLAKRKKVAVLVIAHLRKRASGSKEDYIPSADDISGSGAFKQDSTEVMIVVRSAIEEDGDKIQLSPYGKLFVVKTKVGPNGAVPLLFGERTANIISLSESSKGTDKLTVLGFPDKDRLI